MALKSSITATRGGLYELRLEGNTHRPHWVVQLFHALSLLQVSIVSGNATQVNLGQWESSFMLDFAKSTADPLGLDYAAFSEQNAVVNRSIKPKLNRFKLERRPDQHLDLRLEGPDQIGFLASMLARISSLALFPSFLEIRTVAGQIKDYFILTGIGDKPPTETAHQSLNTVLRSFIV
jgi:UTP:GlnB (protein PII) uridylyltransferase